MPLLYLKRPPGAETDSRPPRRAHPAAERAPNALAARRAGCGPEAAAQRRAVGGCRSSAPGREEVVRGARGLDEGLAEGADGRASSLQGVGLLVGGPDQGGVAAAG